MLLKENETNNEITCYFDSSNIIAAKHNAIDRTVNIIFSSGRNYLYEDVTMTTFLKLKKAESQGKMYYQLFTKGKYTCNRLDDIDETVLDYIKNEIKIIKENKI